jgi:hypothetical protein
VTASIDDEVVFAHCDVCFRLFGLGRFNENWPGGEW